MINEIARTREIPTPQTSAGRPIAKLFWCSTADHDEDWFVVARDHLTACRHHEQAEGYAAGDAKAEYVCDVPPGFADDPPCWPTDAAIVACGGEFVSKRGVRIVRIAGRVFGEGDVVSNVALEQGETRRH